MADIEHDLDWKSLYASDIFAWHQSEINGKNLYYRRIGIVETGFDIDGNDFEGRADLSISLFIDIKTKLSEDDFRSHLALVWAYFRHLHPLLSCKSLYREEFLPGKPGRRWIDKCFVYEKPSTRDQVIQDGAEHITFTQDFNQDVDYEDFYLHTLNTGRCFDARKSLSRLFILPYYITPGGHFELRLVMPVAHEVSDGITAFRLMTSLIDTIRKNRQEVLDLIDTNIVSSKNDLINTLPPAQESLYPVSTSTPAGDRWNWAITRVLRHVRHTPPASFQNPLRRDTVLTTAASMPEKYAHVLDYTKCPPLNGGVAIADLSQRATNNLIRLCRKAGISLGSGAFTLVGMIMMRFEEARNPDIPHWQRLPFVGSFPVNPRPFLSGVPTTGKEDSLMLAFSDGVTLPFIPSNLDFVKTFRVLGRLAHRQLRQWQKKKRSPAEEAVLGSRSPRQMLPFLYLSTMKRINGMAQLDQRMDFDPQGQLPAKRSPTLATCGISSIGDRTYLIPANYLLPGNTTSDVVATFRECRSGLRPRNGEFLVGAIGTRESMQFRAGYDSCAIDPAKAEAWREAILSVLDYDDEVQMKDLSKIAATRIASKL